MVGSFLKFIVVSQIGILSSTVWAVTIPSSQITQDGSAVEFVDSVGINIHAANNTNMYASPRQMIDALDYIGVTTVRDALPETSSVGRSNLYALAKAGIQFNFRVHANLPERGAAGMKSYLNSLTQFLKSYPGSIVSVEGINEANINAFSYQGDTTVHGAAAFQCELYKSIRGTAALRHLTVVNLSLASTKSEDFTELGNLDACAHASNSHIYTAAGSTSVKQIKNSLKIARGVVPGDPVYVTEIGHHTLKNVMTVGTGAWAQAKFTLSELLVAHQNGAAKTFLYELFDNDTNSVHGAKEAHFGLFYGNATPKPAATALRNFMAILTDGNTGPVDGKIKSTYSINSAVSTVHAVRLEKSKSYVIAVWNDVPIFKSSTATDIVNPVVKTVVKLGHTAATIRVYDPVKSIKPIGEYTNASSVSIPLMDRPLLIEINAARDVQLPK